ncbi:unnamed protein product [Diatraea saccharalis]|uniref:RecA family profile 1 domain-containing protein n=1 Tax=Diatraea saccharalis TaxID=40085 RepID=A0A9N9WCQ3_9NEOP|nr:unnamed protein product [Diatraea saccharalis]
MIEKILPTRLYELLDRNNICTSKQIMLLSPWEIKKLTNISEDDTKLIKNLVSQNLQPQLLTCGKLITFKTLKDRVSTGCNRIDSILNGGFRKGTITEIYGESGSGKTQIALQSIVHNWAKGGVYICTEDIFPVKRYEQIKKNIPSYNSSVDYGQNIFIEHIVEMDELFSSVRVRLPKLLSQKKITLVVIDSVAAPFRVDSTNYIQRADQLKQFANTLINIAQKNNIAILCINQVTSNFGESSEVIPSLGLAWSNMICTRLWMKKTSSTYCFSENKGNNEVRNVNIRELSVEFSPDVTNSVVKLIITSSGIHAVQ